MATWHQQQAQRRNQIPLWHATQWTVVSDPPGGCMCLVRFDTKGEASAYQHRTRDKHSYVLPPMAACMRH